MRYMIIVKADANSEEGAMPTEAQLAEMGNYNDELIKAGIMQAGEGLLPSSKGKRVRFEKDRSTSVIDGPFSESKELIAGFWIWNVKSEAEAIEWVRRAPFEDTEIEIRRIAEAEDFGEEYTPELRAQEDRQRAEIARQQEQK